MKHKYEVFVKFKVWKANVNNEKGRNVKYLKSDLILLYQSLVQKFVYTLL